MYSTVSLIGMPGAGKSTVGVLLAKALGLNFVDTDLLIQVQHQATLQQLLERHGHLELRARESAILLDTELTGSLISTGGSAVYSDAAMQRLCAAGPVVFIDIELETVMARIDGAAGRGIACAPGASLAAVYNERLPLYRRYASHTVNGATAGPEVTAQAIVDLLEAS